MENSLCTKFGGVSYNGFCFINKIQFKKIKNLQNIFFSKKICHKLYIEFKFKNSNYKLVVLKNNKPSYEDNNIVVQLFHNKVTDWDMLGYILKAYGNVNYYQYYIQSLFNIVIKNINNLNKCKMKSNFYEHHYCLTYLYNSILQNLIGTSILDVGTCTGILPIIIKKNYPNLRVVGSDIRSLEDAKILAKKNNIDVSFIYLDILKIKKNVEKFDTVIFSHVLNHFSKQMNKKIINNLLKLTNKRLIIDLPIEKRIIDKDHKQAFDQKKLFMLGKKFYYKKFLNTSKTQEKKCNFITLIINKNNIKRR